MAALILLWRINGEEGMRVIKDMERNEKKGGGVARAGGGDHVVGRLCVAAISEEYAYD